MLFDLFGSLVSLSVLLPDQAERLTSILAPAINIPIWNQYMDLMKWILDHLADLIGSAGLAIVVFTVIIKTLLLPLTVKSIRSSKAMQEIAPKIKEIQKKYGKDRQRASQETMALYQAHGVNPMAGCLPMLLQIPIFFGLYYAIRDLSGSHVGLWENGFLWLPSLSDPDPWKILPILAGVFQFIQARMMRPIDQKATDPQQQIMNTMMNFMPLMVVVFGWNFDSGPVIYWVTQAIYSVVQQWLITGWGSFGAWFPFLPELPEHRRLGYQAPRPLDEVVVVSGGAGAQPPQKGFSAWLNRKMMEAQETAQERQDAAKKGAKPGTGGTAAGKAASTRAARGGKAPQPSEEDEVIDVEDDDIATSRSRKRAATYHSRTAGSKFGAGRIASAENGTGDQNVVAMEPAPARAPKTGKSRTKPKRRPTI